jgi:hypothetical protein
MELATVGITHELLSTHSRLDRIVKEAELKEEQEEEETKLLFPAWLPHPLDFKDRGVEEQFLNQTQK